MPFRRACPFHLGEATGVGIGSGQFGTEMLAGIGVDFGPDQRFDQVEQALVVHEIKNARAEIGGNIDSGGGALICFGKRDQTLREGQFGVVAVCLFLTSEAAGGAIDDSFQLGLYRVQIFTAQRVGNVDIALGVEKLDLLRGESGHGIP